MATRLHVTFDLVAELEEGTDPDSIDEVLLVKAALAKHESLSMYEEPVGVTGIYMLDLNKEVEPQ